MQTAGVVMAILLVGLVLLWPYLRSGFLTLFVPIGRGTPGVLEDKISGNAVFVGGQEILIAPSSGAIEFRHKKGDSVKTGSTICVIRPISDGDAVEVKTPVSGVFFNEMVIEDMLLSSLDLSEKDASEISVLATQLSAPQPVVVEDGQVVSEGEMIARVVSGDKIHFYLVMKTEKRPDLAIGDKVRAEVGENVFSDCTIVDVVDGKPPGYSVISGEISEVPPEKYVRTAYASLITRRQEGIVVPSESLVEKDGQTGVLTVQKTYARFRPVEVLMVRGDQAVIKGIDETSEIVLKGKPFLDGRRVR
ncbi:MAG: hypothetical protein KBI40_00475 [Firmicutes bacterium]|nr:hypothetical protein [Candidatus Fermentithermobacillaceae bacterium]